MPAVISTGSPCDEAQAAFPGWERSVTFANL